MWLKGLKDGVRWFFRRVSMEVHCKSVTDTSAGVTLPFHFQVKMVCYIWMEEETPVIVLKKMKHNYQQTATETQLAMRQKAESFPTFAVLENFPFFTPTPNPPCGPSVVPFPLEAVQDVRPSALIHPLHLSPPLNFSLSPLGLGPLGQSRPCLCACLRARPREVSLDI